MRAAERLAYLGGMMDGDGYLKITKSPPRGAWAHAYYGITLGVQQLMPGEAVRLFAAMFDGKPMPPTCRPGHRPIARCEVHVRKAEAATRRLLPYLLVKRGQAMVLLEAARIKRMRNLDTREYFERLEGLRDLLVSLHEGSTRSSIRSPAVHRSLKGYDRLGPAELGWTQTQLHAYLAGIMDSDGSFRIEKRNVPGMLHAHYRINIRCAQVAPSRSVELLARTFGGSLGIKHDGRPHARDLVTWSLHDRAAVPAVKSLLPYLVNKKGEAWLLLELRRLKEKGKEGTSEWVHANRWRDQVKMRKRHYTSAQVASFERLYDELRYLHSGRHPGPNSR
jgi:hypothetical protein